MIIISIFSLILLTSFLIERKKCTFFSFKITPNSDSGYFTEKTLYFSLSTSAKNITWDFGDGSDEKSGVYVSHQYYKAGKYFVRVSTNQDCDTAIEINIRKNPFDHTTGNELSGPETVEVEADVEFKCRIYADTWSWEVQDYPIKARNEKLGSATFRFSKAGTYSIQVTLDNDRTKSYRKTIVVTDNRVKPKPANLDDVKILLNDQRNKKDPTPVITEPTPTRTATMVRKETFKNYLISVLNEVDSRPSQEDLYKFLFRREETEVKVKQTGQPIKSMKFNNFYTYLSASRNKISITDVKFMKDPDDPSKIDMIEVTIEKQ
jgi:PKD repeat protein